MWKRWSLRRPSGSIGLARVGYTSRLAVYRPPEYAARYLAWIVVRLPRCPVLSLQEAILRIPAGVISLSRDEVLAERADLIVYLRAAR